MSCKTLFVAVLAAGASLLFGCIGPPPAPTDDNCLPQERITSITVEMDDRALNGSDRVILPPRESESKWVAVRVTLSDPPPAGQYPCLVVKDKELFTDRVAWGGYVPVGEGQTASPFPHQITRLRCEDQDVVIRRQDGGAFRTHEKQTRVFVQAVSSVENPPDTGDGGERSVTFRVRCPDLTISE
jgi:hypothetical protein